MRIERIAPDDPRFRQWHAAIEAAYAEGREPGWWESLEATATYFARPETRQRYVALVATEGATVVGGAEIVFPLDQDTHTMSVELGVDPSARGRGVASALADAVRRRALRERRTLAQTEVFLPSNLALESWPGALFAQRFGLRCVATEHRFLLDLPFDETSLDPPSTEPGYSIESWVGSCPDRWLNEWARLQTQMNQDLPVGDRTVTARPVDEQRVRESDRAMAEQGWTKVRSMALDRTGTGAGYTEIFVSRYDQHVVVQDDTLVDRRHRGRGLGKRLKVANLRLLQAHDGGALLASRSRLQTYCEQDNVAMRQINADLGFVTVDTLLQFEGSITPYG